MRLDLAQIIARDSQNERKLTWNTFSRIRNPDVWEALLDQNDLELNLEGIDFFAHDGLSWLVFVLLYRDKVKRFSTSLTYPRDKKKIRFLRHVGVTELRASLDFNISNQEWLDVPEQREGDDEDAGLYDLGKLSKLRLIYGKDSEIYISSIIATARDYLLKRFQINPIGQVAFEQLEPFGKTIREFCLNIASYGGLQDGDGLGVVSFVPPPKRFSTIRYCFSDIGRGFRQTILDKKLPTRPSTDIDAILEGMLFRHKYRDDKVVGIYPVLRFIRKRNGAIRIRSGDSMVTLDLSNRLTQLRFDGGIGDPTIGWIKSLCSIERLTNVPGSHVAVDLTTPREATR